MHRSKMREKAFSVHIFMDITKKNYEIKIIKDAVIDYFSN